MKNYSDFNINILNLKNNVNVIKNHIGNNVLFCAMVKANAYGHDLKTICEALKNKADFFGVATLLEAKKIRRFNKTTPILIVGLIETKNVNWCAKNNVSITVDSLESVRSINKTLTVKNLKIHFKINTGLNRIGFNSESDFVDSLKEARKNTKIICEGIFTHFATKQDDEKFILNQHEKFNSYLKHINSSEFVIHCCNSYATMKFKSFHHNMVRCGFAMFGYNNYGDFNFKPVLKITSKIISIHNVSKGETIGYDRTLVAQKNMQIGVIGLGYADGFDRRNSNVCEVIINNSKAKVIGNICMDVFMVDLSNVNNAKVYDEVLILGGIKNNTNANYISTKYYANLLNTSEYEVFLKFNYNRMNLIVTDE